MKLKLLAWLLHRWVEKQIGPDKKMVILIDANEPTRPATNDEQEIDKLTRITVEFQGIELIHLIMQSDQFDQLLSKGMMGRLQQDMSFERMK